MRTHPITGVRKMHEGTDYWTFGQRWEVFALEKGIVVLSLYNSVVGNRVDVYYPNKGITLSHRHLHQAHVYKGKRVDEDTVLGLTGTTGSSTGIHLHLGLMIGGRWVDPEKYDYDPNYLYGAWDEYFTEDLQRYFKTSVDQIISGQRVILPNIKIMKWGVTGSQLVRAIEKWLGLPITGQLTKRVIMALQARMGTMQDGLVSQNSALVREMKRRLSEGTL